MCPHCGDEIESLRYSQLANEYGDFYFPEHDNRPMDMSLANYIVNRGNHESEGSDDGGEASYECPSCGDELEIDDVVWENEEAEEEAEITHDNMEIQDEENPESLRISVEQKYVCRNGSGSKGSIVFCPKCLHETLLEYGEDLEECPNCGKKITKKV